MKRILLPVLAIGVLLLSACGAPTTAPPETITITLSPETITVTPSPEAITITLPPETVTVTPPPETITVTPPPQEPPTQIILNLSPQQASDLIKNNKDNPDFIILDVRTVHEAMIGEVEIHVDYGSETFRDELNNLDKNKVYLIYSRVGESSGEALAIMEELGFMEVYNILGGFDAWRAEGLPVVEGDCP